MITNALKEINEGLSKFTKIHVFEVVRDGQYMLSFRSNYGLWTHDEIPFDRENITKEGLTNIVSRRLLILPRMLLRVDLWGLYDENTCTKSNGI